MGPHGGPQHPLTQAWQVTILQYMDDIRILAKVPKFVDPTVVLQHLQEILDYMFSDPDL